MCTAIDSVKAREAHLDGLIKKYILVLISMNLKSGVDIS